MLLEICLLLNQFSFRITTRKPERNITRDGKTAAIWTDWTISQHWWVFPSNFLPLNEWWAGKKTVHEHNVISTWKMEKLHGLDLSCKNVCTWHWEKISLAFIVLVSVYPASNVAFQFGKLFILPKENSMENLFTSLLAWRKTLQSEINSRWNFCNTNCWSFNFHSKKKAFKSSLKESWKLIEEFF